MGIMGKVVGGTIGFAIGGPLGAIAGAAFGHAYDAGSENLYIENKPSLSAGETTQVTFFVAAFSMLAKMAKADGRITREEIDSIEKFMLYDLNLDPQSRQYAMNIFHAAGRSPGTFQDFANQYYAQFRGQPQFLDIMVDILLRVSIADGVMSPKEEALILEAVRIFHFSETHYQRLKSRHVKDVDKYYAVLGCNRSDSNEEIKKQYRKRVAEFHPDKIASKGLPAEFTKFAEDKFREVQEAYEKIKAEKGFK